jgi:hypothetical protein
LGIRPTKGSFSFVAERELAAREGDVAQIRDDDISSRIGSELSDRRNAVQVRLKKGEVVEILGQELIDGETWFKIAPPAGEFRWIHAASVERRGPISESTAPADDRGQVVPAGGTDKDSEPMPQDNNATAASTPTTTNEGTWQASSAPAATAQIAAPDSSIAPPPLAPIAPPAAPVPAASTAPTTVSSTASAAPPVAPVTAGGFDLPRQLTDLEMRLSRMAAAPPHLWNTDRLQHDAEQLLGQAKTQADRDAVKATMGKIDRFNSLARRYQGTQVVSPQPSAVSQSPAGGQTAVDGRHDAVGILRPVVSKRPGAPQFALVDERGQVVTFVTPTPDVNLQPYVGRRIGIAGNRGFIPEFNRAHVTAGRVTPMMR